MEVLLRRDDVDHLVKAVLLPSLGGTGNITGDVHVRAVLFAHDRLGELERGQVDDERTVRLLDMPRGEERLERCLLRVPRDGRLARVDVKVNVETGVRLAVLCDGQLSELAPQRERSLVAWLVIRI